MKAIVHIGMPKTGTSTIQEWLVLNKDALSDQGFFYDRMSNLPKGVGAQIELVVCMISAWRNKAKVPPFASWILNLKTEEDVSKFVAEYEKRLTDTLSQQSAHTCIISAENISMVTKDPENISDGDAWLRRHFDDVRYLVYLRRQEDWLLSSYAQSLKGGDALTLDQFLASPPTRPDWFKFAQTWVDAVGRDRLIIKIMDEHSPHKQDLVEGFAQGLGVDASKCQKVPSKNQTPSAAGLELLYALNARYARLGHQKYQIFNEPLWKSLRNFLALEDAEGRRTKLTQEQKNTIQEDYAQSNEALRQAFFPEREALFPPNPVQSEEQTGPFAEAGSDVAQLAFRFFDWHEKRLRREALIENQQQDQPHHAGA